MDQSNFPTNLSGLFWKDQNDWLVTPKWCFSKEICPKMPNKFRFRNYTGRKMRRTKCIKMLEIFEISLESQWIFLLSGLEVMFWSLWNVSWDVFHHDVFLLVTILYTLHETNIAPEYSLLGSQIFPFV